MARSKTDIAYPHSQVQACTARDLACRCSAMESRHTCYSSSNQRRAEAAILRSSRDRAWQRNVAVYWDRCCCTPRRLLSRLVPVAVQGIRRVRVARPRVSLASHRNPLQLLLRHVPTEFASTAGARDVPQNAPLLSC